MSVLNLKKYKDESWDFREADTKEYTHCFHTYPAMMIPQIARQLLKEYGTEDGWLLDPTVVLALLWWRLLCLVCTASDVTLIPSCV